MSDQPQRLRLFVDVRVPLEVLEELDAVIAPYKEALQGARWTPIDNQHVTLKFLGSVMSDRHGAIDAACRAVVEGVGPSEITVRGLGAFPSPRRARVVWAGITDPDGLLTRLAARLDEHLAPLGFEAEARAFKPHLTLARLKTPISASELVDRVAFQSRAFVVSELHLYRSHLSPRGARYEVLETFVLS